jgi:adenosylcobinamide-phosphate synthase
MDQQFLLVILPLTLGYLLDLILGDPRWLWHPIRLFGNNIRQGEQLLNHGKFRFIKGTCLTLLLCSCTFLLFFQLNQLLLNSSLTGYIIFNSLFVFYALANRSLLQEGKEVFVQLKLEGIEAGRKRLSWIVGRDTSSLNEKHCRKT